MSSPSGTDSDPTSDATYVGVCVGVDTLIAAAPADARLGTELVIDGDHVREQHDLLRTATRALQRTGFDTTTGEAELFVALYHQLRGQVYGAAVRTVRYARRFDTPRIVLAERSLGGPSLWERRTDEGVGAWLPAATHCAVAETARASGVSVVAVDATRAVCHVCGESGRADGRELRCQNENCPVDRVGRRRSRAVRLAGRARSA